MCELINEIKLIYSSFIKPLYYQAHHINDPKYIPKNAIKCGGKTCKICMYQCNACVIYGYHRIERK